MFNILDTLFGVFTPGSFFTMTSFVSASYMDQHIFIRGYILWLCLIYIRVQAGHQGNIVVKSSVSISYRCYVQCHFSSILLALLFFEL